jgi:hypothetical protein
MPGGFESGNSQGAAGVEYGSSKSWIAQAIRPALADGAVPYFSHNSRLQLMAIIHFGKVRKPGKRRVDLKSVS